MIFDGIACGQSIVEIFATEKYLNTFPSDIKFTLVSENVFNYMSDEVTPQGALAVVKINKSEAIGRLTRCLLLDRVQDPGNMGTILRICAACGIKSVFTIDCVDAYSPKAVRSSMSGIYHVNVIKTTKEQIVAALKEQGVSLICADMNGESLFSFDKVENFCLCMGNEGNGICDYLIDNASSVLSLPMKSGVESLNVAVATAVILYNLTFNI